MQAPSISRVTGRKTIHGYDNDSTFDGLQFEASGDDQAYLYTAQGTVWDIKPGTKESMYQHQQEGFEFLWKNLAGTINLAEMKTTEVDEVGGCIISHAPGTGKTRLTAVFVESYMKVFPNCLPVIVAPAGMLLTWEEEFKKWKIGFPFHNLNNLELTGHEHLIAAKLLKENKKCMNMNAVRMVKLFSWSKGNSILGVSYSLYEKLAGQKFTKKSGNKKRKEVAPDQQKEIY